MATKVFFYTLRPYDELSIAQRLAPQLDIEFGYTQEYPTLENTELAKGYDAVSVTPCDMSAPMVKRFHELGVKSICCRSIGYDHVDRETARTLGMKVFLLTDCLINRDGSDISRYPHGSFPELLSCIRSL